MKDTLIDLTGQTFGHWKVLKRADNRKKIVMWLCKCDCGTEKIVQGTSLKNGTSNSCGCHSSRLSENHHKTHGLTNTKLYRVWQRMKNATTNVNNQDYKHYGKKGVMVCSEWFDNFLNFYNWSITNGYKEGLTIDRIDNNGNYEPNNCRWTTQKVQTNNYSKNILLEYDNEIHTIAEWAEIIGIKYTTLYNRLIKFKWTIEKASSKKVI